MSNGDRRTKLRSVWSALARRYPDLASRHGAAPWDAEGRLTRAAYDDLQTHLPKRPQVSQVPSQDEVTTPPGGVTPSKWGEQQFTPFPTTPSGTVLPRSRVPEDPFLPEPGTWDYYLAKAGDVGLGLGAQAGLFEEPSPEQGRQATSRDLGISGPIVEGIRWIGQQIPGHEGRQALAEERFPTLAGTPEERERARAQRGDIGFVGSQLEKVAPAFSAIEAAETGVLDPIFAAPVAIGPQEGGHWYDGPLGRLAEAPTKHESGFGRWVTENMPWGKPIWGRIEVRAHDRGLPSPQDLYDVGIEQGKTPTAASVDALEISKVMGVITVPDELLLYGPIDVIGGPGSLSAAALKTLKLAKLRHAAKPSTFKTLYTGYDETGEIRPAGMLGTESRGVTYPRPDPPGPSVEDIAMDIAGSRELYTDAAGNVSLKPRRKLLPPGRTQTPWVATDDVAPPVKQQTFEPEPIPEPLVVPRVPKYTAYTGDLPPLERYPTSEYFFPKAEKLTPEDIAASSRNTIDYSEAEKEAIFSAKSMLQDRGLSPYADPGITQREQIDNVLNSDKEFITVWHGTNLEGARGILRTGQIRGYEGFGAGITLDPRKAIHYSLVKGPLSDTKVVLQFEIPKHRFKDFEPEIGGTGNDEFTLGPSLRRGTDDLHLDIDPSKVKFVLDKTNQRNLAYPSDAAQYADDWRTAYYTAMMRGPREIADEASSASRASTPTSANDIGHNAVPIEGNKFVAGLPGIRGIYQQVEEMSAKWAENMPKVATVIRSVNPSGATFHAGAKAVIAHTRAEATIDNLIDSTMKVSVGAVRPGNYGVGHEFRGPSGILGYLDPRVFEIDSTTGMIKGIDADWNTVFENYGTSSFEAKYKGRLTDNQIAYIEIYRRVIDEAELMRRDAGLAPRATKDQASKDVGWHYVPRLALGVKRKGKDIEFIGRNRPGLERIHDIAEEGILAGVKYESDPEAVLRLHLKAAYKEILDADFKDMVDEWTIDALEGIAPGLRARYKEQLAAFRKAKNEVKRIRVPRATPGQGASLEESGLRRQLADPREAAREELQLRREELNKVRDEYNKEVTKAKNTEAVGNLTVKEWRNNFYRKEDAEAFIDHFAPPGRSSEELTKAFSQSAKWWGRGLNSARTLIAGTGDIGQIGLHGQTILGESPVVFFRSVGGTVKALIDPPTYQAYLKKNSEPVLEMAQHNLTVGDPEVFAALEAGQGIPVGAGVEWAAGKVGFGPQTAAGIRRAAVGVPTRQITGRIAASYNMFLGTARVELWKALRQHPDFVDDPAELAAYLRNLTGALDSRALGVGPAQRNVEAAFVAFSPRLFRSTAALMNDAAFGTVKYFTPGMKATAKQKRSARALYRLIGGAVIIYAATGLALGKSWEEIRKGLNPLNGKEFLSYQINGDWVGLGGYVRSIIMALSGVILSPVTSRKNVLSTDTRENPALNFLASRGALGTKMASYTGETLTGANLAPYVHIPQFGWGDLVKQTASASLPLAVQGIVEGEQALTVGAAIPGARTSPGTPSEMASIEARRILERGDIGPDGQVQAQDPVMIDQSFEKIINSMGYSDGSAWSEMDMQQTPDYWTNLPPSIVADLRRQPDIQALDDDKMKRWSQQNRDRFELETELKKAKDKRVSEIETLQERSAEKDPEHPGTHYRLNISRINASYHQARKNAYARHPREIEPTTSPVGIANREIAEMLFPPTGVAITDEHKKLIADRLGTYVPLSLGGEENLDRDWDEYDRRYKYLEERYSPKYMEDYMTKNWDDKPEIEQKRNRDFDLLRKSGWWDTMENSAANLGLTAFYEKYQSLNEQQKRDLIGSDRDQINMIRRISQMARDQMRMNMPDINQTIEFWGFSTADVFDVTTRESKMPSSIRW